MKFMNNQKGFAPIVIVLIIVALFVGGIFIWQYFEKEEVKIPEEKTSEEMTIDETADWKIYRNEEYGYEIKYPQDWEKGDLSMRTRIFVYKDFTQLPDNSKELPLKDWLDWQSKKSDFSYENFDFYGSNAFKVKTGAVGGYDIQIIIEHQDKIYSLSMSIMKKEDLETFNQILSTFRFVE